MANMKFLTGKEANRLELSISFNAFWQELERECGNCDCTMDWSWHPFNKGIRPKRLWNSFGRETACAEACKKSAVLLSDALKKNGCLPILARHYKMSWRWMPPETALHPAKDKEFNKLKDTAKTYLSSVVPVGFKGAILLESHEEIQQRGQMPGNR